jgi:protein TonB
MMFEQIRLADGAGRTRPWSFAASMTLQSILVAAALALPMLHVAQLETKIPVSLILPRTLGAREPVRQIPSRNTASSAPLLAQSGRTYKPFQAPSRIPATVATGPDLPGAPVYAIGDGGGNGDSAGIPNLPVVATRPLMIPPPEPKHPALPPASAPATIRVGEGVQAAKLMFGPKPAYPVLAKQARISGTVRLAAQISADYPGSPGGERTSHVDCRSHRSRAPVGLPPNLAN